ncbi:MAG: hypothetical protein U9R22_10095 [Pseudomonadota bacterium]|nr:hypothetical protein [Pseudomonadota bacterium]
MRDPLFWNQLLARRDTIAALPPGDSETREALMAQLLAVVEPYDRHFDPADDFEAYVAVSLCRAIAAALADGAH